MSPQNAPFLVLSFAIRTWLCLYDRPFVQGAYIFQVKRPFISLNMVLVSLINYRIAGIYYESFNFAKFANWMALAKI